MTQVDRVKVSMVFAMVNCHKHARSNLADIFIPVSHYLFYVSLLLPGTIRSDWLSCMVCEWG